MYRIETTAKIQRTLLAISTMVAGPWPARGAGAPATIYEMASNLENPYVYHDCN